MTDDCQNYEKLREKMVTEQVQGAGRDIHDPKVVVAMRKVPRHLFVPESMRPYAYEDRPLSISEGQTISQPYIVAFMTEVLNLKGNEKILEIGTGSGYQAAVLAEIVSAVYTIEIVESLAQSAARCLRENGYTNVKVKHGDGYLGWPEHAPYDAIIVTCAPNHVPQPLQQQLKIGGRMIIPVGGDGWEQNLVYLEKTGKDKLVRRKVLPVRFVPMTGRAGKGK